MQDQPLATKVVQLTKEGLDELKAELKELIEVKLPAVIERVARAREYGDLSENAEYHSAKEEQLLIEARIDEIEEIILNAKVITQTKSANKVGMGSVVTLQTSTKPVRKMTVTVVGEFEATPGGNKISSVSPLGKALVGRKKSDVVMVKAPAGEVEYTILEIK